MAAAFLFGDLDNELLVVGDGEFLQSEDRTLRLLAVYHSHVILGAERFEYLLLHGGSLDNLLIHNLERYVVDVESDIGGVLQLCVEVEHPVVGVNGFQEELHPETL